MLFVILFPQRFLRRDVCNIVEENKIESPENLKANKMPDGSSAQSFHLLVPLYKMDLVAIPNIFGNIYIPSSHSKSNNRVTYILIKQRVNRASH